MGGVGVELTSWILSEHERLAELSERGKRERTTHLADDLMGLFVSDLNHRTGGDLQLVCRPDVAVPHAPAPDYLYEDCRSGTSGAFEVTQPIYDQAQSARVHCQRFLDEVRDALPKGFAGCYWVAVADPRWKPPPQREVRDRRARAVAEAIASGTRSMPREGLDLSPAVPARVLCFDVSAPVSFVALLPTGRWSKVGPEWPLSRDEHAAWYRCLLREASAKLAPYGRGGSETFLLLDGRLADHLTALTDAEDIRGWHRQARGDARARPEWEQLCCSDFGDLDHIILFRVEAQGVCAESLWPVEGGRMATPLSWSIQPPGWRAD
jgi:hypothetical protein